MKIFRKINFGQIYGNFIENVGGGMGGGGGGGDCGGGQFPKKMDKITQNLAKSGKIIHRINASRRGAGGCGMSVGVDRRGSAPQLFNTIK